MVFALLLVPLPARAQIYSPPRLPDGKPDLQGIWQIRERAGYDLEDHAARDGMLAARGVVEGGAIPYQPWAAAKKKENFLNRATADPLGKCFMPGVPRIMHLNFPFHIFQTPTHIAIAFEWSHIYRIIYLDGSPHQRAIDFWMGDSRGRWEGDTLVVEVTNHNDQTWLDMAGNFHSEAMRLVERYTRIGPDTIRYEVTVEDPKVFTRPWKIAVTFGRRSEIDRILEYECQAEAEEARGDFAPQPYWYRRPEERTSADPVPATGTAPKPDISRPAVRTTAIPRMANGKPNMQGFYTTEAMTGSYGLENHPAEFGLPGGPAILVDPPDKQLPYRPWAFAEYQRKRRPENGHEDPTAHCFVSGVPRAMYVLGGGMQILQTPSYFVMFFERMAYRIVPLDGRPHIPDIIRLWEGDSIGRWEGDTLVIDATNFNGKSGLTEKGDFVTHTEHVVERLTMLDANTIYYEATVDDPLAYSKPWTIAFNYDKGRDELLEVACHEEDQDLAHLKALQEPAK